MRQLNAVAGCLAVVALAVMGLFFMVGGGGSSLCRVDAGCWAVPIALLVVASLIIGMVSAARRG